jgi:hypothetical protein
MATWTKTEYKLYYRPQSKWTDVYAAQNQEKTKKKKKIHYIQKKKKKKKKTEEKRGQDSTVSSHDPTMVK